MYDYIGYVLANYFNVNIGDSEEGAISGLQADLVRNTVLSNGLRSDMESALNDSNYSWKAILEECNVFWAESEDAARSYAKHILWDFLFNL
jgi:hypothetical protein